ncbi:serine/threonine-protein kinase [Neorhodopirellula pilleata]|uniref:non-specific serine/threonine protein kinase n=1 Tax=Neorhodopirellula pilleata TaxID=2714738 RepID=A0A5C5ZZP7_9BACT|nr:serine/threonine-protein kinase [Neorhodopirellula pilleata]TWT93042.1 Serine/threonine-protein kinase PknB [Neorhodopirellula pilleata]
MSDLVGRRLGEYQILRKIGSGGMADVYAARQLQLQRDVALKALRADSPGDDANLKRFQREAQAAARLNHPSIVQVYEFGETDGVHYIAQELVDGINLKQSLDRDGPIDAAEAIDILRSVASALQIAHDAGVTHRDIKPENIMRGGDGAIKVTDFGLARLLTQVDTSTANLTRAGLTLGTPRYMSPEQIQGHAVDARSDLYSLGVTMYHLLAGSPPFDADEPIALAVKHLNETPMPLDRARGKSDLPEWLVSLVMQCLQKSPEARYGSAADLLSALDLAGNGLSSDGTKMSSTTERSLVGGSSPSGVSAATIHLQRVVDQAHRERSKRRRRLLAMTVLSIVGIGIGGWLAERNRFVSISQQLRGPIVTRADSIAQQYLIALTRNDLPAWRAVLEYFPADVDETRNEYHQKAKLQMARLWIEQEQFREAGELLDQLEKSASVKRLYRLMALTLRHQMATEKNDVREASRLKSLISQEAQELATENPSAMETFRQVVPSADRTEFGLLD